MKKADFEGIVSGLQETGDYLRGEDAPGIKVHIPSDIDAAKIRKRSGLSQTLFAETIGVSIGTLRNWEQGRRMPDGPARVLLAMLARNPKIVEETLGRAA